DPPKISAGSKTQPTQRFSAGSGTPPTRPIDPSQKGRWWLEIKKGMKQDSSNCSISLSQEHYIKELLECFNMDDANSLSTPLSPRSELLAIVPSLKEQSDMKSVPYLSAVGALQYLATMTRPDIAYAVSYLERFNHNPAPAHWLAVKHLLRYLKGTMHYQLI